MESIGFKEWAIVCAALGRGRQSIILRKGGIAEGGEGFSFQHREFFLFPTWFHEQPQKVRDAGLEIPESSPGRIEVRYLARLECARVISSWRIAEALEPLHILTPEVVRERFEYDQAPGLHVGFVRVFELNSAWTFVDEKKFGGCRSWVKLPEAPKELRFDAVLSDADHARVREDFLRIVGEVK
jgi:hypothetical protein